MFLGFNNCHPNPCVNGTCMDQDNTYTCSCFDGYKGNDCDGKFCSYWRFHLCFSVSSVCLHYLHSL